MGFTVLPWDDLAQFGTAAVAAAVDRAGDGKAFVTFDIDFVDPAFAPGTGTPECGGPSSMQALSLLRACRGLDIVGADVVEVLPDLDHSHLTGTLAATVAWEILSLIAAEWQRRPAAAPARPRADAPELRGRLRTLGGVAGPAGVSGRDRRMSARSAPRRLRADEHARRRRGQRARRHRARWKRRPPRAPASIALPGDVAVQGPQRQASARARRRRTARPTAALAELAARHDVYVLAGSIYEPAGADGRVFNTSALFGPDGACWPCTARSTCSTSRAGDKVYRESDDVVAGSELVTADIDVGEPRGPGRAASTTRPEGSRRARRAGPRSRPGAACSASRAPSALGLTICYDLRFPELYRSLALLGAQVLCVPSAFTALTGAAHWEVLLRARAIENGCFVIAPGQVGEHLPGRDCYGHTMIVDPWGDVLSELYDDVGVCVADLDLARLDEVRAQIPSLENRRAGRVPAVVGRAGGRPARRRPREVRRRRPWRRGCRPAAAARTPR